MTEQRYKKSTSISESPIIIAGPCSAETREQVLNTAEGISKIPEVSVYRAGIWKPRTKPGTFEGVGAKALPWLEEVKEKYALKTCVEIAKPEHVEMCLKKPESIDMVWLGARTTGNPFSVQAIADVLKGSSIPVMIKNPINPDLNLWVGATQRILDAGIKDVIAIHRGFYPFSETYLRNVPKWEIAIDYRMEFPDIPMLNDPSHIAGNREYIFEIAQRALNLNFNGLMIETHICPEKALSDAEQQITPVVLAEVLTKLHFRKNAADSGNFSDLLQNYRDQIDSIDYQLIELLSKRMAIVENIGKYKSEYNVSIFQLKRWLDIVNSRIEFSKQFDLHEPFVKKILQLVHQESIRQQSDIMNDKE